MDFNDVLDETIDSTIAVLAQKAGEYATTKSRYHNFEVAGRKRNCTPEEALMGMKVKHDVAVDDLVAWVEKSPEKLTLPLINEKIGDSINYLILLKGMLINRVEAFKASGQIIEQMVEDGLHSIQYVQLEEKVEPYLDYVCKTITFPQGASENQKQVYFAEHPMIERGKWRELEP